MTPSKWKWLAGHLVALAAGVALALPHGQNRQTPGTGNSGSKPAKTPDTGIVTSKGHLAVGSKPAKPPATSAETFRMAWKSLQEQPKAERNRLRSLLLEEWSKVDLQGALEATMLEPDSRVLLDLFTAAFDTDPDSIKACFAGERYGLKTAELRSWWIQRMASRDPDALFAQRGEFGPLDQAKIVSTCLAATRSDPAHQAAMIGQLSILNDTANHRKLWAEVARELAEHGEAQSVLDRLCAIPGPAGRVMVGQAMVLLLEKTDYAGARASYSSLPPDLRREIAEAALVKPGKNPGAYLAAMDEVIQSGDWKKLSGRLAANLHEISVASPDSATLLAWAAKLPERDETLDIYRVAVRGFVVHQPEAARKWIATVPTGWKRENSLAAFAQAALTSRQQPADAKWALDQLTDPKFKAMAQEWIAYYEKKTGRTYPR